MIHDQAVAPPASPPSPPSRRAVREEELLGHALDLVAEGGLEALTVQALAARMRWSVGALYRYFAGMDALLAELQVRVLRRVGAALDAAVAAPAPGNAAGDRAIAPPGDDAGDRAIAALLRATEAFRVFTEEEPAGFALITSVLGTPKQLLDGAAAESVGAALRDLLARVERLLRDAEAAGALPVGPTAARTLLLWTSLQGLLQLRKLARLDDRLRALPALVHLLVDSLLLGWGVDPARLARLRAHLAGAA